MQIDVSELKQSPGLSIHRECAAVLPALEGTGGETITFAGPAAAVLDLTNRDGVLLVTGTVRAVLRLPCSRCLETFTLPVEVSLAETYYPEGAALLKAEENEESIPFRGDVLDITPEVLKAVLLALPMKPVCRPDCRGLCPRCGRNLNLGRCTCGHDDPDPRLAVLKDLLGH